MMSLAAAGTPVALRRPLQAAARSSTTSHAAAASRVRLSASRPTARAAQAPRIASVTHITGSSSRLLSAGSSSSSGSGCRQRHAPRRQQLAVAARSKDPDALDAEEEPEVEANKVPPSLFWRCFSALCYLVPWIDSISLGRAMYSRFRNLLLIYFAPGPLAKIYFGSQFAPLIIFFVMFLSIVKNNKLHHFVRFNCMQAIMLDIVVMLFHILRAYLPSELKWSLVGQYFDMFGWTCCMGTVLYAVFWTVRGYYADIHFVSESVYHQVKFSEFS